MLSVVALVGLVGLACAGEPQAPVVAAAPTDKEATVLIETIEENTVGDLGGHRVPMGNMTTGEYTLPDGSTATGPICSLPIEGRVGVFVGVGSVVDVGGTRWQITDVTLDHGDGVGSVSLQQLDD